MTTRRTAIGQGSARPGRPALPPQSPLGALIVERLLELTLSRGELADRLGISSSALSRLLSGAASWVRLSPLALADALQLYGSEREHLLDMCAHLVAQRGAGEQIQQGEPPESDIVRPEPPSTASQHLSRTHAGRPPHAALNPLGRLIAPLLRERGMTRSALAETLGVRASTVTRMMNGDAAPRSHAVTAHGLSDALGLEGVSRRAFIEQALALGAFALVSGQSAPALLRFHGFDLAQVDTALRETQRVLDDGNADDALQRALRLYERMLSAPFPRSDWDAAVRRMEAALLLGRAQEATLPWGATRTAPAVQTYNQIDQLILSQFSPSQFAYYYARLYERRAPLYRELEDYAESIRQFTLAIEVFMPHVDDPGLLATLYRNRAHVWAVQGDERRWRLDIERASQVAGHLESPLRQRVEAHIRYSEAEGYKRLAGAVAPLSMALARRYAQAAVQSFLLARAESSGDLRSHHLLLNISLAQSHIWLAPEEARRLATDAHTQAQGLYPALLRKSELTIGQAKTALASRGQHSR